MTERALLLFLRLYVLVVLLFVFAPILASFVFSFNSDRFPTIPLGEFTTHWYQTIFSDADVWEAFANSLIVAVSVSVISTVLGFCTAYTDFRFNFRGKAFYLALALTPPTIPLVIMGLAMLALLSRINLSGLLGSIIVKWILHSKPPRGISAPHNGAH